MKLLIFGNSSSGKSTFARAAAREHALSYLELDTIVWTPHELAVPRPPADVEADLARFLRDHDRWVVDGCEGNVIERALPACTELIFMNPGVDVCLALARARPWEPHKFESSAAQDQMLPFLLDWIRAYYERDDTKSYAYHRRVFDAFGGPKRELTATPTPR